MSVTSDMTPMREVSPLFYREAKDTHSNSHNGVGWVSGRPTLGVLHAVGTHGPANSTPPWHELLEGEVCVSHTVFFFSELSLSLLVSM